MAKTITWDYKSPFKEAVRDLPDKDQRIIREKVEFIKLKPRRGDRIRQIFPEEFREHHASRKRILYIIVESPENIHISFLAIEIRKEKKKTYGKQTINKLRKIAKT